MSDDIVSRLWQYTPEAPNTPMETRLLLNDAANEILRLRAEVARLGSFLYPAGMVINTEHRAVIPKAGIEGVTDEEINEYLKEVRGE